MSDFEIDHEVLRARAEKRLQPQVRLWWRRRLLYAMVLGFVLYTIFVSGPYSVYVQLLVRLRLGVWRDYDFVQTGSTDFIAIAAAIWVLWGLLIPVYALSVILAYGRERAIQREMNREMELETLRLQLELARARGLSSEPDELEKPKRAVSLADDGELHFEETPARRRSTNHRQT